MALPGNMTPFEYARSIGSTVKEIGRRGGEKTKANNLAKMRKALEALQQMAARPKPKPEQQVMGFLSKVVNRQRI